jgi:hypothetical protein
MRSLLVMAAAALCLLVNAATSGVNPLPPASASDESGWIALFNGRDLQGWVVKLRGHPVGVDPFRTFRVEDGLLTVDYQRYEAFDDTFGHLFHVVPRERYRLRVEYRFIGTQAPGGPAWAVRNSGVMLHAQSPWTMGLSQDFPVSLEAQLLGGVGRGARPTLNLCTPGTHVYRAGALVTDHCIAAAAPTVDGDAWVTVEVQVDGARQIRHLIDAAVVLDYERPVVGGGGVSGHDPALHRAGARVGGGYMALQSESHPVQFRRVLVRPD